LVACRYVALEVLDMFNEALAARHGLEIENVFGDIHAARRLVDAMPSADVWVSLVTARHRNPHTTWIRNHIFDADAMSVAVPYCNLVVADRETRHLLNAAGVPDRLGTQMPANVVELADFLAPHI
jgi:hypothetical protein